MANDAPAPPPPIDLEIRGLTHEFKGRTALADVSFAVHRAAIHGFVGPNGAGKTTTLKVAATLLRPQRGYARVCGFDVQRETREVRRRIGFMPDHFSMYRQMTVAEYLDFFGAAYGLSVAKRDTTIQGVLALTDMEGRRDELISSLSRGMQQRVSLARALINDPQLLLLDEPASGLDPRARIELMEILRELSRMGKTVFISSHILGELADLCDSVTIIDGGRIKYTGSMKSLLSQRGDTHSYLLELAAASPACVSAVRALPGVIEIDAVEGSELRYAIRIDPARIDTRTLLLAIISAGAPVETFRPDQRHLNQVFMELTTPGVG
ncbi:MAG: ABC transporter ATP-binding protein [Planctomycetota bacterium]